MTRTECDNCRALGSAPPPAGWVIVCVQQQAEEDNPYSGGADVKGMFCGWACAGEYASAKALIPAEDPQESRP